MLLDSYTLKSGLTSLLPAPAPAGFVKRVNTSFTKIDILLKTIQVRPSPPEALIQAYLVHLADRSEVNFRRILELKGIRSKQDQSQLVELFHLHRATDRYAPNLQQSNPLFAVLQQSSVSSSSSGATAGSSVVSQGLGLSNLGTTAAASISGSNLPGRFDPSMLGSAIISAAKDGVDRFGNQSLAGALGASSAGTAGGAGGGAISPNPSGTASPAGVLSPAGQQGQRTTDDNASTTTTAGTNLNENLKNIGKFFRRDLGGFGGRFGRGGGGGGGSEDANR
jgi:hypothetical protein